MALSQCDGHSGYYGISPSMAVSCSLQGKYRDIYFRQSASQKFYSAGFHKWLEINSSHSFFSFSDEFLQNGSSNRTFDPAFRQSGCLWLFTI